MKRMDKMGRKKLATVVVLAVVVTAVVAAFYLLRARPSPGRSSSLAHPSASFARLNLVESYDAGLETNAFSILLPEDWQLQGGIQWRAERPLLPASLAFRTASANASLQLECFQDEAYFWVDAEGLWFPYDYGPETRAQYAMQYQGYEARRAIPAGEYLSEVIIPRYRGNVAGLQLLNTVSLSGHELVLKMENLLAQRPEGPFPENVTVDAAKIELGYTENGRQVQEEIWCMIVADTYYTTYEMEQNTGVRMASAFWYPSALWSLKSDENITAEEGKLLMTVFHSFAWDPEWLEQYSELLASLWKRHLDATMAQQDALTQAQNEVARIIQTTFSNQEEVMDRVSDEWSNVIRGVEQYDAEPGLGEFDLGQGAPVLLPNGYDFAWTNGQGDYILTDSANFDPNVDLETNLDWVKMRKR